MKKQLRTAMLSTACMLIVAVMSLTGVTYAWFTQGDSATVTGMQMNVVSASGGVEVSSQSATEGFTSELNLSLTKSNINPVSTADGVNFFTAEVDKTNTANITAAKATGDANVIIQKLWIRNTGASEITITLDGSSITSAENTVSTVTKVNLVKAARMVILNTHDLDGLRAEGVEADTIADAIIGGIYAPEGANDTWYGVKAAGNFKMYSSVENQTQALTAVDGMDSFRITLPGMQQDGTVQAVPITIIIWLEGQDTNANNANAGGAFKIDLALSQVQ